MIRITLAGVRGVHYFMGGRNEEAEEAVFQDTQSPRIRLSSYDLRWNNAVDVDVFDFS